MKIHFFFCLRSPILLNNIIVDVIYLNNDDTIFNLNDGDVEEL